MKRLKERVITRAQIYIKKNVCRFKRIKYMQQIIYQLQ